MYAVFETGGKQYKGAKGDIVWVEKLPVEPGKTVTFSALVVSDGDKVQIGTPTVNGVKVKARVMEHGKEKKVIVYKYKSKDNYRKKQGHRQPFTKIKITDIASGKAADDNEKEFVIIEDAPAEVGTKVKAAPKPKAAETEAKAAPKAEAKAKEVVIIEDTPVAETKAPTKAKASKSADMEAAAELGAAPKAKAAAAEAKAEPKAKATGTKTTAKAKTAAKTEE